MGGVFEESAANAEGTHAVIIVHYPTGTSSRMISGMVFTKPSGDPDALSLDPDFERMQDCCYTPLVQMWCSIQWCGAKCVKAGRGSVYEKFAYTCACTKTSIWAKKGKHSADPDLMPEPTWIGWHRSEVEHFWVDPMLKSNIGPGARSKIFSIDLSARVSI